MTLPVLTEEEAQRRIKEGIADVAKLHNIPVDSLPAPARIVSPVEWTAVIAQCLTDGGFPTTVEPDGTSSSYIPPGQEPTVPLPTRETFREHPSWSGYPDDLPRAQREQLNWQCPASPPFEALGA